MHLAGIGAEPYGPQLPCCQNAADAATSALIGGTGPACDPNCVEGDNRQAVIERMQAAIDDLTRRSYLPEESSASSWFPGVSNSAVILVGVGLGAILLLRGRR